MELSASQAAKEVGKSIQTITRAIESGRLTAQGPKGGPYKIDRSELYRVWNPKVIGSGATPLVERSATIEVTNESNALQAEVKVLREMLDRERDTVSDLRTRLDTEGEERRRLTALLTVERAPAPAAVRSGFFHRLFGG